MKTYNQECFAAVNPLDTTEKPYCRALSKLDCEGCRFYKHRDEIKDNVFYKFSFKTEEEYRRAVNKYKDKYGQSNVNKLKE